MEIDMEPKVSVITPMYNVEGKIDKCIQTLFAQTLTNFEVIFVDDHSTDHTLRYVENLLNQYSRKDINVHIIHLEKNGGVANARNVGLNNASGKYIYYVDADDYIEYDALEQMYEKAESEDADIVVSEWLLTFAQKERHVKQPDAHTGLEAFELMTNGVMRWNLWLFLVRRSLYVENEIQFIPGMNMGEDMMVMLKLVLSSKRVCVIHKPLYHYIQTNSNSLTKDYLRYKEQLTYNVLEVENYLTSKGLNEQKTQLHKLKLAVKLPLLISSKKNDYEEWQSWFPESNSLANTQYGISTRTYLLQKAAYNTHYWYLKLYYICIIKLIYGIIYK